MKKIIAIGILFVMLLNTSTYYFVFKIQQKALRKEAKALMRSFPDKSKLEKIIIPNKWLKGTDNFKFIHSLEFELNEKLYDIIYTQKSKDTTIFYSVNDKNEEDLMASYKEEINPRNSNHQSQSKNLLIKLSKLISVFNLPSKDLRNIFSDNALALSELEFNYYTSKSNRLESPPPRF